MHPLLKAINDHLALIVSIIASLSVLIPRVRQCIGCVWRWVMGKMGMGKLDAILAKIILMEPKLEYIEREMRFNGGNSLRDIVVMQHNRQQQQFWRSVRPSMEIDGDAMVTLVSESACHLFDVADPREFYARNWLQFIEPGRVDDILRAYTEAIRTGSRFTQEVHLRDYSSNPLGCWQIILSPLTQPGMSRQLYSGYLRPTQSCELAKEKSKALAL